MLSIEEIEKRIDDDSYELPNRVLDVMPEPMVTVRTSTYQHAPYIKQCIEGVLMQKTTFPFEFIIGEDFSTDGTRETVFEYAKKYPDIIRVFTADYNVGAKANGQRCIRASRGKYMAICEGDDYWTDPQKLQKQVDFLEGNEAYSGCAHQAKVVYNSGKEAHLFRKNVPLDITVNDMLKGRLFHTASILFNQKILESYKNPPQILSGDRLLNFLIAFGGKIRFFDDCMCVYRKHDNGMSSTVTVEQMKLDLNMVPFLQRIDPSFPKYHYLSFIHSTIAGYSHDATIFQKNYYMILSCLYSFCYFPKNIRMLSRAFLFLFKENAKTLFAKDIF